MKMFTSNRVVLAEIAANRAKWRIEHEEKMQQKWGCFYWVIKLFR